MSDRNREMTLVGDYDLKEHGIEPPRKEDVETFSRFSLRDYGVRLEATLDVDSDNPGTLIFAVWPQGCYNELVYESKLADLLDGLFGDRDNGDPEVTARLLRAEIDAALARQHWRDDYEASSTSSPAVPA